LGFGSVENGIVAGVIYHNYDNIHRSIELSCYGINNKWFTKRNLNIIFDYPFNQLNLRLIRSVFDESNQKSTKLFKTLNGNMVKIPDLFKDGENAESQL
jgi:RimJ/RimL family protein N-acetyltransferase